MPIIAESPPLIIGGNTQDNQGTRTPRPARTPRPPRSTPTPTPFTFPGTPAPGTPVPTTQSNFVNRHQEFINTIESLGACFKREDLGTFSDQEFADHAQVAIQDKYLVQNKEYLCSMQAVQNLARALRRASDREE